MANGLILRNALLFLTGLFIFSLQAEETNTVAPTAALPAAQTPAVPSPSKQPKLVIDVPKEDEILKKSDAEVFIHVQDSTTPSEQNHFHVFLDREPPILHEDDRKPITLKNLAEGGHILRVLAVQSSGLSIPLPDSFAAVRFFVKKKDLRNFVDLGKPYITVNLPTGGIAALDDKQRVCFDFLVHNVTLGKDGYKVRYLLNQREEILSEVRPVYWPDLPPGKHSLVVELLDPSDNPVLGLFSRVERKFEIAPILKPLHIHPPNPDDDENPGD